MSRDVTNKRKAEELAVGFLEMLLASRTIRPRLRTAIYDLILKIKS